MLSVEKRTVLYTYLHALFAECHLYCLKFKAPYLYLWLLFHAEAQISVELNLFEMMQDLLCEYQENSSNWNDQDSMDTTSEVIVFFILFMCI